MTVIERVIRTRRAVLAEGIVPASVAVGEGSIVAVGRIDENFGEVETVELAQNEVLLPGLVDVHVHVNEPGRTEWEGYESATKAAAAGGITTLIDMPLNSKPSTTTPAALELKQEVARSQIWMDVGFWGGALPATSRTSPRCGSAECSASRRSWVTPDWRSTPTSRWTNCAAP